MDFPGLRNNSYHNRGITVGSNGDFYIYQSMVGASGSADLWGPRMISIYGADCKLKKDGIVTTLTSAGGLQVDRAGNIFIGCNVRPQGMPYPESASRGGRVDRLALLLGLEYGRP